MRDFRKGGLRPAVSLVASARDPIPSGIIRCSRRTTVSRSTATLRLAGRLTERGRKSFKLRQGGLLRRREASKAARGVSSRADTRLYTGLPPQRAAHRAWGAFQASRRCRPIRQCLGQCGDGELLLFTEDRADREETLPHARRCSGGRLRFRRAVLQSRP